MNFQSVCLSVCPSEEANTNWRLVTESPFQKHFARKYRIGNGDESYSDYPEKLLEETDVYCPISDETLPIKNQEVSPNKTNVKNIFEDIG